MKMILLPVDGSEHAAKAAGIAGDLAAVHDASVVVLYVHNHQSLTPEQLHMAEVEHIVPEGAEELPWVANMPAELAAVLHDVQVAGRARDVVNFLAKKIVSRARDVLTGHGVKSDRIRFVVKNGDPAERIVETAKDLGADTIVMGSRGMTSLASMVFGSVSRKVMHQAPCTVVAVR